MRLVKNASEEKYLSLFIINEDNSSGARGKLINLDEPCLIAKKEWFIPAIAHCANGH